MKLLSLLLFFPFFALAQPSAPLPGEAPPAAESPFEKAVNEAAALPAEEVKEIPPKKAEAPVLPKTKTEEFREDSTGTVMAGYQLLATWVPSKLTVGYTHIFNRKWSLEGEFSYSSLGDPIPGIDLGSITERRYTLQARRYVGSSFHFTFGPVLSDFSAELDASVVGQGFSSNFSAQNLGVTGGIGSRWQFSNGITFGIDWFRLNVPLIETRVEDNVLDDIPSAGDRDDVKDTIRSFNRIPTFVLFGLNLGYTF